MNTIDRRKYLRVETSNFISYESIEKNGEIVFNSMGRALAERAKSLRGWLGK